MLGERRNRVNPCIPLDGFMDECKSVYPVYFICFPQIPTLRERLARWARFRNVIIGLVPYTCESQVRKAIIEVFLRTPKFHGIPEPFLPYETNVVRLTPESIVITRPLQLRTVI